MILIEPYIYEMGLEQLTKSGSNYNFRCPCCGDSKKSAKKKRGWFKLSKNNQYYYCCFNCGEYYPFITFLKLFYPPLYQQYKKDNAKDILQYRKKREKRIKQKIDSKPTEEQIENTIDLQSYRNSFEIFKNKDFTISKTKNTLVNINLLSDDHIAKKYVSDRMIENDDLLYTKSFMHLCNSISPGTFQINPRFDERLVIPFYDRNHELIGMQGRSLDKDVQVRYLTWIFDKEHPKIYGCDKIDINDDIWIVEGPIDSMFLPNCLAIAGADFDSNELLKIANKEKFIFLYDPENRNIDIINVIRKRIEEGFRVCILPEKIRKYGKDINDFVMNGLTVNNIMQIAKENVFFGTNAKIRLNLWVKRYIKKTNKHKYKKVI